MNKLLPLILFVATTLVYSNASSQDNIPEFGKPYMAELLLHCCPFDIDASAMNLLKTESISFNTNGFSETPKTIAQYRVRIKIFKESGFKYASVIIPYSINSHSVKITDVEAYIYTLNDAGKIVVQKLDKSQIFKEKTKSAKALNSVRFTFPGLKNGAVIEYRYTRIDKNVLYLPPWPFQDELPQRLTTITVTVPLYTRLQYHSIGNLPLEKDSAIMRYDNSMFNEARRSFTLRDVPAFKAEPFMSSLKDNLQRVEFATAPNGLMLAIKDPSTRWKLFSGMLLDAPFFGQQYDVPVENTAPFLATLKGLKEEDIIASVYNFVKKTVAWNGERNFYPVNVADSWKDRTGSSAEMNILLLNLLRKAGIRCDAVLVSTRDNGRIDKAFPNLGQFNSVDVIAVGDDKVFVLDCTQPYLSYKTTPFDVLNREALLINNQNSKWVTLTDENPNMRTNLVVNATMDTTGVMSGTGEMIYTGIAKAEAIQEAEIEEKEKSHQSYSTLAGNDGGELKIDSLTQQHNYDDNDTLLNKIAFHYALANTGDIYFLNPFIFSMFKTNPFNDSVRFSDIDFGSDQVYSTSMLVSIPQNFSIEEVPPARLIRMADSSIVFNREVFISPNNQLLIRNVFTINRALFAKEEYSGIKAFFDKLYALMNELVLLKRKG